jgi:Sec7-like guanine-nucleotide exchange factor
MLLILILSISQQFFNFFGGRLIVIIVVCRDPFCIAVLHSYVDNMNFQGMEIDAALR